MEKYELKDVIFSLRNEYKLLEQKLEEIRDRVEFANGKDTVDFNISKYTKENENVSELRLIIVKRQSAILNLLQQIGKVVSNGDLEEVKKLDISTNGETYNLVLDDKKHMFLPTNSKKIIENAEAILTSEFVKDMPRYFTLNDKFGHFDLERAVAISPWGLNVRGWEENRSAGRVASEFLGYNRGEDELKYSAYRDLALTPSLDKLLHAEVSEDKLSDYQKSLIETSGVQNKKFSIEESEYFTETTVYNIDETHDEIRLVRK
jgi:hypothetical protein